MNIPSSSGPSAVVPQQQPVAGDGVGDGVGGDAGSGDGGGESIKLLESGSHDIQSVWDNDKPDAGILKGPGDSPLSKLAEKMEPELKGMIMTADEKMAAPQKNGKFMKKVRSLARNAMKMFACTNPNTQEKVSASRSMLAADAPLPTRKQQAAEAAGGSRQQAPYLQFAEKLTLTGANEIVAYMNLGLLDDFHNSSREIPEIRQQISSADRDALSEQLTQKPGLLQPVLVSAGSMDSIYEGNNAYAIVKANPDIPGDDAGELLAQHLQEAALATTNALEEPYTPQNPKLREIVDRMPEGATKLHHFGDSENNPYQALSQSEHFTEADDQHLRSWLNHGLQVLDKSSRIMQAVLVEQDTSLTILGDLYQFTHLDEPGVADS